jgi:hypothetical protein
MATPNSKYEIKVSRLTEEPIPDYPIEIQFGRDILGCNLSEVEALELFQGLFQVLGKKAKELAEERMCDGCETPCENCDDRTSVNAAESYHEAMSDLD